MNETMMNALAALFEKHRIVFWYCEDPLLVADFEACAMPTVEKRDITGHPLATKVEVLLERPKDKFLLFCRGPRPADEENFLIDVLLANAEFQTDKASLLATDLGLGPEATPVIKSCMGFFAAAKRVQELKSRLKDGGTENLEGLMLGIAAGVSGSGIERILMQLYKDKTGELARTIDRCGLTAYLWRTVRQAYGYESTDPSLDDFAMALFGEALRETCGSGEPGRLASAAFAFLSDWRDNARYAADFEMRSRAAEEAMEVGLKIAQVDWDEFIEGRGKLETDVWIDTLLQSIGLNPEKFGRRNKFFQLMRLVPFCERNYNLIELGPKGTGKSHVYSECSPHGMLLSGGEVTLAKLFVNNATGKLGLVGYWDCIAFDEFAGKQKRPDKSLVDVMKNYMANKTFSRGIETLGAEASIAFVGNTMHSVPQMLKKSNLFEQLPDAYLDSAFIDRIHNYIPGWEVDIIRGEMFSSGYGFIIDYLSEVLHSMRELDYTTRYQKYFTLSPSISTRDKDGVQKTFSGLMKIVYPSGDATKEEIKELLTFAMEGRKRVKDQLFRIDPTYDPVDFSFTDNESGAKISVKTLEEVQYPNLYGGASEGERPEPTSPLEVDAPVEFSLKDAPRVPENRVVEILENQTGVDYECLFGACLEGVRQITITDPFIRTFYQARNLMEFMEMLLRHKTPEDELSVILRTTVDDFNAESQQGYLNQIKESCGGVGIEFVYSFENGLHDRSIVTDTGWFMTLGRGLDIYQPCDLKNAFAFASRVQSQRPCKAFTVTYHR